MKPTSFEKIKLGIELILAVVVIITLGLSYGELNEVGRQNLITQKSNLYTHANEMHNVFIENPKLKIWFYAREKIDSLDQFEKSQLETTAELVADLLDHWATLDNRDDAYAGWPEYALSIYNKSVYFKNYIEDNKNCYPALYSFYNYPFNNLKSKY